MLHQAYGVTLEQYVNRLRFADIDVLIKALEQDDKPRRGVSAFSEPPDLPGL